MATRKEGRTRFWNRERGQAFVLMGLLFPLIAAMVGVVIDGGQLLSTRTRLQSTVDAATLAAAQDLPDPAAAEATVHSYIEQSGLDITAHTVVISSSGAHANDLITVTMDARVGFSFLRIFGSDSSTVGARAAAQHAMMYQAGANIVPWAFVTSDDPESAVRRNSCYTGNDMDGIPVFRTHTTCTIKYGAGYQDGGDFGAIRLEADEYGATEYLHHLKHSHDMPHYIGDEIWPQTGNLVGPTRDGTFHRIEHGAPPGCAGTSRDDILRNNADGTVSVRAGCETSKRLILVPIVDHLDVDVTQPSTIRGFALAYIAGMVDSSGNIHETQSPATQGLDTVAVEFIKTMTPLPNAEYGEGPMNGPGIIRFVE